jgi:hypothetical protein
VQAKHEYAARNGPYLSRQAKRYYAKYQQITGTGTRSREPWTSAEDAIVVRNDIHLVESATCWIVHTFQYVGVDPGHA